MKKTIGRILASACLVLLVAFCGLLSIILFPKPLFAHKLEHGQFVVHANKKIDVEIKVILDNATHLIKHSELYRPDMKFDVYLSYNTLFNTIDDTFVGHGPVARATNEYVNVKAAIDIKRNLFFRTYYQKCEGDLTYLITHEIVHVLQERRYGKLKFNPFIHPEHWKLEGYPEYIARRTQRVNVDYDLPAEIDNFINLEKKLPGFWIPITTGGCQVPKYYYKGRLMTEYLMDVKKYSYDSILNDTTSEAKIYAEMLAWRDSKKKSEK